MIPGVTGWLGVDGSNSNRNSISIVGLWNGDRDSNSIPTLAHWNRNSISKLDH